MLTQIEGHHAVDSADFALTLEFVLYLILRSLDDFDFLCSDILFYSFLSFFFPCFISLPIFRFPYCSSFLHFFIFISLNTYTIPTASKVLT
jgi:hypothetical protein